MRYDLTWFEYEEMIPSGVKESEDGRYETEEEAKQAAYEYLDKLRKQIEERMRDEI